MPSLQEKFQLILSIRTQILDLVAQADAILPKGGYLILSELLEETPVSQSPSLSETHPGTPEVLNPGSKSVSSASSAPSRAPAQERIDQEETRPHTYTPRPDGTLKGKTLAAAVEEVMRNHFSQVPAVNRQVMVLLADEGFDGFGPQSLEEPMEQVRNALAANPNVDRPTRKTYIWKPKNNPSDDKQAHNDGPSPAIEQRLELASDPTHPPTAQQQQANNARESASSTGDVTFLELVTQTPGKDPADNGDEDL